MTVTHNLAIKVPFACMPHSVHVCDCSRTCPQDHFLGRVAPTFIGSFGTYSWTIAYLSEGSRIHLPYYSSEAHGTDWLPWHALFIHDDERIMYSDCGGDGGEPVHARQVLAGNHAFARAVAKRPDARCGPRLLAGKAPH